MSSYYAYLDPCYNVSNKLSFFPPNPTLQSVPLVLAFANVIISSDSFHTFRLLFLPAAAATGEPCAADAVATSCISSQFLQDARMLSWQQNYRKEQKMEMFESSRAEEKKEGRFFSRISTSRTRSNSSASSFVLFPTCTLCYKLSGRRCRAVCVAHLANCMVS